MTADGREVLSYYPTNHDDSNTLAQFFIVRANKQGFAIGGTITQYIAVTNNGSRGTLGTNLNTCVGANMGTGECHELDCGRFHGTLGDTYTNIPTLPHTCLGPAAFIVQSASILKDLLQWTTAQQFQMSAAHAKRLEGIDSFKATTLATRAQAEGRAAELAKALSLAGDPHQPPRTRHHTACAAA